MKKKTILLVITSIFYLLVSASHILAGNKDITLSSPDFQADKFSKVFHRKFCAKLKIAVQRTDFISFREATEKGYKPCSRCVGGDLFTRLKTEYLAQLKKEKALKIADEQRKTKEQRKKILTQKAKNKFQVHGNKKSRVYYLSGDDEDKTSSLPPSSKPINKSENFSSSVNKFQNKALSDRSTSSSKENKSTIPKHVSTDLPKSTKKPDSPETSMTTKARLVARKLIGPKNYNECISKYMKVASCDTAAQILYSTCKGEFRGKYLTHEDLNYYDCIRDELREITTDLGTRLIANKCRKTAYGDN